MELEDIIQDKIRIKEQLKQ